MDPYLNKEHPSPAYHCGRLMAVLAFAQEKAIGQVNAGIVRRTLGSVMTNPGLHLGRLEKAAEVGHFSKLDKDLASFLRDELKIINVALKDGPPPRVDTLGQSLFMVGFYQEQFYVEGRASLVSEKRRHRTQLGEWVASKGEVRVSDLLIKFRIKYAYEPRAILPTGPERWPDFVVAGSKSLEDCYIEYLGYDSPEYDKRWEMKLVAFREYGITPEGGPKGKLIIVDARKQRLGDPELIDLLRPVIGKQTEAELASQEAPV